MPTNPDFWHFDLSRMIDLAGVVVAAIALRRSIKAQQEKMHKENSEKLDEMREQFTILASKFAVMHRWFENKVIGRRVFDSE